MSELAQRLGYGPEDRLLIINCDDLGFSHAANVGVYRALRDGVATSATIMVPCPWAREAASQYRGEDIGVHLTLTAEYDLYRWGPITHAPSLLDGDGGFPRTNVDSWEHADVEEVRRECRAQVERAILWGFDVSHLDSHMGTLQLRPEFFDVYLDLAIEYGLPLRLSGRSTQRAVGFPFRDLASEEGVLYPDHFVRVPGVGSRASFDAVLDDLKPGVTEVYVHPAVDAPELRAIGPAWEQRVDDLALVTDDALRARLDAAGVIRIGFRELRDSQRGGMSLRRAVLGVTALVLVATGCDDGRRAVSRDDLPVVPDVPDHVVELDDDGFGVTTLVVATDEFVEFRIGGDEPHGIRADTRIDTGELFAGERTLVVFDEEGTYEIVDVTDPDETMTVESRRPAPRS